MPFLARESTPGAVEELQPHGEEMEDVKESNTHMVLGAQNNKVSFASIEHLHEYATNVDADATDGGMPPLFKFDSAVLIVQS